MSRIPDHVVQSVTTRAEGFCEAMIRGVCNGRPEHLHHRQLRSRGGGDTVENLTAVCHRCHDWIHRHPKESTALGLMVSRWADPAEVPMAHRGKERLL